MEKRYGLSFSHNGLRRDFPEVYEKHGFEKHFGTEEIIWFDDISSTISAEAAMDVLLRVIPSSMKDSHPETARSMVGNFMLMELNKNEIEQGRLYEFKGSNGVNYSFTLIGMLQGLVNMKDSDYIFELYKQFLEVEKTKEALEHLFRHFAAMVIFQGFMFGDEMIKKNITIQKTEIQN